MRKADWSPEWPAVPGRYWFYGEKFRPRGRPKPEMHLVEVQRASNCLVYTVDNCFLHEQEGCQGLWKKADLPKPPAFVYRFSEQLCRCPDTKCAGYDDWSVRDRTFCHRCWRKMVPVVDNLSEFPMDDIGQKALAGADLGSGVPKPPTKVHTP